MALSEQNLQKRRIGSNVIGHSLIGSNGDIWIHATIAATIACGSGLTMQRWVTVKSRHDADMTKRRWPTSQTHGQTPCKPEVRPVSAPIIDLTAQNLICTRDGRLDVSVQSRSVLSVHTEQPASEPQQTLCESICPSRYQPPTSSTVECRFVVVFTATAQDWVIHMRARMHTRTPKFTHRGYKEGRFTRTAYCIGGRCIWVLDTNWHRAATVDLHCMSHERVTRS